MTKKEAFDEATRRWFVANPAGGYALCVGVTFLGRKGHPTRFQVGRREHGKPTEILGVSTQSWEDAFFNAETRLAAE